MFCTGDEVVYIDPHTTQEAGTVGKKAAEEEEEMDRSHHCSLAQRMPLEHLDPSLALVRDREIGRSQVS